MGRELGSFSFPPLLLEYLFQNLSFGSTVLEFGSGEGTKRLCERYKVISVEDQKSWLGRSPSTYIYAPIRDGWYDTHILDTLLPSTYDAIIVDGPHSPKGQFLRGGILRYVHKLKKVLTLVDDIHRPADREYFYKWCRCNCIPWISAPDKYGRRWGRISYP